MGSAAGPFKPRRVALRIGEFYSICPGPEFLEPREADELALHTMKRRGLPAESLAGILPRMGEHLRRKASRTTFGPTRGRASAP
jgi:hypothetical protein